MKFLQNFLDYNAKHNAQLSILFVHGVAETKNHAYK